MTVSSVKHIFQEFFLVPASNLFLFLKNKKKK